ncbi:hypothetical protein [Litorimonas haliclonae]
MTNQSKTPKNPTKSELKSEKELKGKLKDAEFPEIKHQADAALGEEEEE